MMRWINNVTRVTLFVPILVVFVFFVCTIKTVLIEVYLELTLPRPLLFSYLLPGIMACKQ